MKNLIKFIIIFSILSTPVQAACDFLIDIGDSGKKVFDKFDMPLPGYKGQYYLPVATDSSGDVYVGQYWIRGIKKFTYSTKSNDTSFASSGTYRGSGNCRSYYPLNMKVHNNKLYVASFYQNRVFRIDLTSGSCDWNQFLNYPRNISIAQNTLYATGYRGMLTYNIIWTVRSI